MARFYIDKVSTDGDNNTLYFVRPVDTSYSSLHDSNKPITVQRLIIIPNGCKYIDVYENSFE